MCWREFDFFLRLRYSSRLFFVRGQTTQAEIVHLYKLIRLYPKKGATAGVGARRPLDFLRGKKREAALEAYQRTGSGANAVRHDPDSPNSVR